VEELNKKTTNMYKYVLLNVIGGRANEETKTLEIMAKFGRTRCQKTEDRYFCQTTPEMHLEEKLFKVDIRKKTDESPVEFAFEEKPADALSPMVQKLYRENVVEE